MATVTANTTESITLADAPKATSVLNNSYFFLNQGVAQGYTTTYQNLDLFKIDSKFDVNESGSVKVYKSLTVDKNLNVTGNNTINGTAKVIQSLEVSKNLIVTGNTTISGILNIIPPGVIVMWSGSFASIPAGWKLCDGSSGTPDLRNRFIVGATPSQVFRLQGTVSSDISSNTITGIGTSFTTQLQVGDIVRIYGVANTARVHQIVNETSFVSAIRPLQNVSGANSYIKLAVGSIGGSVDSSVVSHQHTAVSTSTVTDPGHVHNFNTRGDDGQGAGAGYSVVGYNANIGAGTGNMSSATTGVTVATETYVALSGESGTNANLPPYYALCFIMKS
jgi:hypothetical protein